MRLISVLGVVLLSLLAVSCEGLFGPDGGQVHQRVQVTVSVRPEGAGALVNGLAGTGTGQIGTSLIFAVPDGTTAPDNQADLDPNIVYDKALLDLAASTVTLILPIGVSMRFFEYTFNDIYSTVEDIETDLAIGGAPNISDPVAVPGDATEITVSLPLTATSFQESFSGALDPALWQETGAVTSSGGTLQLTTSETFSVGAAADERLTGSMSRIRSNRNILLNSHRVVGTLAVQSFSVANFGATSPAVRARAQVRLHYQPQDSRGDATGLTIVRLLFQGVNGGTYFVRMDAGTCTGPICSGPSATFVGFDAAHTKYIPLPLEFSSPDIPFSLEYIGSGVFRGTINGVSETIDVSDLGTFDANDFREVELRAQSNMAFDASDAAAITATFTNLEVGDDGLAGNEGGPVRTPSPQISYVSNNTGDQISGFDIDPAAGTLTPNSAFPLMGLGSGDLRGIKLHPSGQFLYIMLGDLNQVLGFRIDPATKALTALPASPYATGALPFQMAFDPRGEFAYVNTFTDGSVTIFSVDQSTGDLTPTASSPFALGGGAQAGWVAMHPSGDFVFVSDFFNGNLWALARDTVTGDLSVAAGSPVSTGGISSFGVAAHPGGGLVFVANFGSGDLSSFQFNATTGVLTLGTNFSMGGNPISFAFAAGGDLVYASNEISDVVDGYSFDPANGALTPDSNFAASAGPEVISVEPSGKFLLLPMLVCGCFASLVIDTVTGDLTLATQMTGLIGPIDSVTRAVLQ